MTRRRNQFRALSVLGIMGAVLVLGGCGSLIDLPGSGKAPAHFQLSPAQVRITGAAAQKDWDQITLYLEEVTAPGALRATNIQVRRGENELQYLGGATWSDRTPRLLGRFMTEALESAGAFQVVGQESIEIRAGYRLKMDLREFAVYVDGARPVVHVRIQFMLVRGGPVEIIATRSFDAAIAVADDSPATIVAGFEDGLNDVAAAAINWLVALDWKVSE